MKHANGEMLRSLTLAGPAERRKWMGGWRWQPETVAPTPASTPHPHPPYDGAEGPHFLTSPWGVTVFPSTFSPQPLKQPAKDMQ